MTRVRSILLGLAVLLVSTDPVIAQESGAFIVRLGRDTTAVERWTRTGNQLVIEQVGRSPRVLRRHTVLELGGDDRPTRVSALVRAPDAAPGAMPIQTVTATLTADSALIESRRDTAVTRVRAGVPAGALVFATSPWSFYERQTKRLARGKADTLGTPLYQVGSTSTGWLSVRRLGRDSVIIQTTNDTYHARIDAQGAIVGVRPIYGTQQVSVDRATNLDLDAVAASFHAREKQGGAMGALSPRDTVKAAVGGANLTIDYSRPSKRGRTIFGTVVPYGQVWRTGANTATQFRTDRTLVIGGVELPAGAYSLFTIPERDGWKLIINGETNQPGTAHKPEKDVHRMDMKVSAVSPPVESFTIAVEPEGQGGVLSLSWDTTRAYVPFTVKP